MCYLKCMYYEKIKNEKINGIENKHDLPSEREVGQCQCRLSYSQPHILCCTWMKFWNILEYLLLLKRGLFTLVGHITEQRPQIYFKFNFLVFKITNLIANTSPWLQNGDACHIAKKSLVCNIMRYEFCSLSQQMEIVLHLKRAAWQLEDVLVRIYM